MHILLLAEASYASEFAAPYLPLWHWAMNHSLPRPRLDLLGQQLVRQVLSVA